MVGAGILGLSAAVHLKEAGVDDVVVVERQPSAGSQTTAAGAGFVAHWGAAGAVDLATYGMEFYDRLQDEAGADLGVRRVGLLFPALSPDGVEFLRARMVDWSSAPGIELVDADDALRLAPILAPGMVAAALHQPDAHQVPTNRIAVALTERLAQLGVDLRLGVDTRRALVTGGRVRGVETSDGDIPAGIIVNAAGASARALAARNGVSVAAVPILESRFVTEPILDLPPRLPMLLFFERDLLYLRGESDGLLVGAIERAMTDGSRVPLEDPPRTDALSSHAVRAHERLARSCADVIPVLGRLSVASRSSGLPTFTPDGRHIAGEAAGISGYFVLAGCNESGVTYGPGLGRLIASLATGSDPMVDPAPYRVDRFERMSDHELRRDAEARYLGRNPVALASSQSGGAMTEGTTR